MSLIGKSTNETVIIHKVAIICDACGRANQYAIQNIVQDTVCGNVDCERVFTKDEIQEFIDAEE